MKISGIDDLIRYVDDLSVKCGWSDADRIPILTDLNQIRSRLADPRLYLGVVGEFSAGKSTFINALLGVELLKEDILQGTTCAPTFLRSGKKFDVEVWFTNGTSLKHSSTVRPLLRILRKTAAFLGIRHSWLKEVFEARDFIAQYTAKEEYSRDVDRVVLTLPIKMPFFSENVVLVDTPGVNAENARHQEVTESAMRRYCDLVVALTVATVPCPQTLMGFLRQNEALVNDRCIGLITQIDRIRKAERARQIRFIQERFKAEKIGLLGLYAAAPYYVVHPEDADTDDRLACRDQFSVDVAEILKKLAQNKVALMTNKTRELLEGVINNHIIPVINRSRAESEEIIGQIESVRMMSFDEFKNEWMKVCRDKLADARVTESQAGQFARSQSNHFIDRIQSKVMSAMSRSEVIRAYTQGITEKSIGLCVVIAATAEFGKWSSALASVRDLCLSDFSTAFAQSYGIDVENNTEKPMARNKRPSLLCSCDISSGVKWFKLKYLFRMIALSAGGLLFSLLLFVITFCSSENLLWGLLAGFIPIVGLIFAIGDVEHWRTKVLSHIEEDREKLFLALHQSLCASAKSVYEYDYGIVADVIGGYARYKEVIRRKLQERALSVRQEQDKVALANEALPVLTKALGNIKNLLVSNGEVAECDGNN